MDYLLRPFRPGEETYVAEAQKRVYSEEYHWGSAFIDYAVNITLDFATWKRGPGEEMWVVEAAGTPVGCIMLCQGVAPLAGHVSSGRKRNTAVMVWDGP